MNAQHNAHNRRRFDFAAEGDFQQQLEKCKQHAPHPAAVNNRFARLLACLLAVLLAGSLLVACLLACLPACLLAATHKIAKRLIKFMACCIECGEEGQA